MIAKPFLEMPAKGLRTWIRDRADAVAEKVRTGQWADAVGMLKDTDTGLGAVVQAMTFGLISDFERVRLECWILASAMSEHASYRRQLLRDRRKGQ